MQCKIIALCIRLLCLHLSYGEPRPTSVDFRARLLSPPLPLLLARRRSLSPYRIRLAQSVTYAMQVATQVEKSDAG